MQSHEFVEALSNLLTQIGSSFTIAEIRSSTKECRDEIYADTLAHNGRLEDPFFNFVVHKDVAVFAFFEAEFSVYVLRCNEAELIAETGKLAMSDTIECRDYLATKHQKPQPDLVVSRFVCEHWLESG